MDERGFRHFRAAAAALALMTMTVSGVVACDSTGDSHPTPSTPTAPATTPGTTPAVDLWLPRIPEGFRLTVGQPGAGAGTGTGTVRHGPGVRILSFCGRVAWSATAETVDVQGSVGEGNDRSERRTLAVYDDPALAGAHLDEVRAVTASCPDVRPFADGLGDDSWAATVTGAPAGTAPRPAVVQVVRRGNALLVSLYAGPSGDLPALRREAVLAVAREVDQLAVFSTLEPAHPDTVDPAAHFISPVPMPSEQVGLGDIPDIPLAYGIPDRSSEGGRIDGPSPTLPGVDRTLACGRSLLDQDLPSLGRLVVTGYGRGAGETHQIVSYADPATANREMTYLRAAVTACPRDAGDASALGWRAMLWQPTTSVTGHDSFTFGQYLDGARGVATWQVTRIGRIVLFVATYGQISPADLARDARRLTRRTTGLVPLLCSLTGKFC